MNFAIILAGGAGLRVGAPIPKQYIEVNGRPLLYYSVKAFEESNIDKISIVADKDHMQFVLDEIVDKYNFKKVISVCEGGVERFNSAFHGLDDLKDTAGGEDIILIHDGARPFITAEIINNVIEETKNNGAAIAAMPVKDTIKIAKEVGKESSSCDEKRTSSSVNSCSGGAFVEATTPRALTWQVQTPQGFNYAKLFEAYKEISARGKDERALITDDSMIWESVYKDAPVKLVKASYSNIKITDEGDLEVAKAHLI